MRVVIDGAEYAPVSSPRFGVAITTRNRPAQLQKTIDQYRKHTPVGIPIIVVDDASDTPPVSDFRFDTNVGIAAAKNKCIQLLLAAGVHHLFLSDDDAYPIADNWWQPYIDSPEPHLFAVFPTPTTKSSKIEILHQDSRHTAYHATRGYFLYLERRVVDRVGGFDTRFKNAFEHVEYSNRIHNAGFTTWPYQDITGSEKLIFCEDSNRGNKSVIPDQIRRAGEEVGRRILADCDGRSDYVPFGTRDIVLSCLFTSQPDPQRGQHLKPDPTQAATLLKSLNGVDTVILCDFPTEHPNFRQVDGGLSPYIQRWISYRHYLTQHPEVRFVWCVDATDVESLQNPFSGMQPGTLYCGWENQIVGCTWMRDNHQCAWIDANADKTLLNAGVVGADRETMLTFCSKIIALWSAAAARGQADKAGDMAYFNQAAYSMTNIVTGPRITTLFKANQRSDHALWKHK